MDLIIDPEGRNSWTDRQLAKLLNISEKRLRYDRCKGVGIPYRKIGASVRYLRADVEGYLQGVRNG